MYIKEINLNLDFIQHANNLSHFNAGDIRSREAQAKLELFSKEFPLDDEITETQKRYLIERQSDWASLVKEAYNDMIYRRGKWVPVTVAGPAKYDSTRMGNLVDLELKASNEWHGKMSRFLENTRKKLKDLTPLETVLEMIHNGDFSHIENISSDNPDAITLLKAKKQYLEEFQARMKAVNAYYRKHKKVAGCPYISEKNAAAFDKEMPKRSIHKESPYARFELTNNLAEIKRLSTRISQIEKSAKLEYSEKHYDKFVVIVNPEANRIQIKFPARITREAYALMRKRGFIFKRSEELYQRKLTSNGFYAAKKVAQELCAMAQILENEAA